MKRSLCTGKLWLKMFCRFRKLFNFLSFDFNTGGKLNCEKRFNNFCICVSENNKSLMCALLKLLTAILIFVNRTKDCDNFLLCGERNGTGYFGAISLCDFYDLCCRRINESVLIALESYLDLCCQFICLL